MTAAMKAEPTEAEIAQAKADAARDRAIAIKGPPVELPPTDAIRQDLFLLERSLKFSSAAKIVGNRKMRRHHEHAARVIQQRIDAARRAQLDAHWSDQATTESASLAQARGEEVDETTTEISDWARDERGVLIREKGNPILRTERATTKRMLARAGLLLALEKGDLDGGRVSGDRLYEIGKQYREAYEIAHGMTTGDRGEGGGGAMRPGGPQIRVIEAMEALDGVDNRRKKVVGMRHGLTRRQRVVLDHVCGRDLTVRETATSMQAGVPSIRRALRSGLEIAWQNVRAE